jgi:hypothetical protein
MLGRTLLGARLRDLRTVLAWLRARPDLDSRRIALWGDSFSPPNPPGTDLAVPLDGPQPRLAEPLGGVLALLGGLFEDEVKGVYARGGLVGYLSLLASPFCHVPYDVVVPDVPATGDLEELPPALAPRPAVLVDLVDGTNRRVASFHAAGRSPGPGAWLLKHLR